MIAGLPGGWLAVVQARMMKTFSGGTMHDERRAEASDLIESTVLRRMQFQEQSSLTRKATGICALEGCGEDAESRL